MSGILRSFKHNCTTSFGSPTGFCHDVCSDYPSCGEKKAMKRKAPVAVYTGEASSFWEELCLGNRFCEHL